MHNYSRFLSAAASGTIPDAFRKEVADLKLAMSSAHQAQQASLTATVAAMYPPVNRDAPIEALLAGTKQLLMILEGGRVLNAGTRGRDLPDDLVDSMAKVHFSRPCRWGCITKYREMDENFVSAHPTR